MTGSDPTCLGIDLPAITMTTFVDFVVAGSGTPKLTAVKNAKARYERGYDPTEDFYKLLRKCIAETARQNSKGSETLDTVRSTLVKLDRRKLNAYQECGEGYKRWRGRKDIIWDKDFNPQDSTEWSHDRLVVRVKPEIGLLLKGLPYIVKLYFKAPQLSQLRLETMYYLLKQYQYRGDGNFHVGILELRRGRLHVPKRNIPDIAYLLAGEAAAFQAMWESL